MLPEHVELVREPERQLERVGAPLDGLEPLQERRQVPRRVGLDVAALPGFVVPLRVRAERDVVLPPIRSRSWNRRR